ncbi:MAG: flagellar basal body rod protein FlgB [Firmicutes bacterium]|nr:flagellar basal body rod protein FlgB [Bacillota bacterium]
MWDKIFSGVDLLKKGMQISWARNAVIRNNIANAETPGFKSSAVEFESIFARSLAGAVYEGDFKPKLTRSKHIDFSWRQPDIEARIVQNDDTSMLFNENNVDIEAENVKLAQNSLYYNTLLTKLNGELARIKLAVRDGK